MACVHWLVDGNIPRAFALREDRGESAAGSLQCGHGAHAKNARTLIFSDSVHYVYSIKARPPCKLQHYVHIPPRPCTKPLVLPR